MVADGYYEGSFRHNTLLVILWYEKSMGEPETLVCCKVQHLGGAALSADFGSSPVTGTLSHRYTVPLLGCRYVLRINFLS